MAGGLEFAFEVEADLVIVGVGIVVEIEVELEVFKEGVWISLNGDGGDEKVKVVKEVFVLDGV